MLIPGTGVVFTVSTGLVQGRRASIYASLGCTAGIVPHLLATVMGLAALLHTSALAFQVLKFAGVAYLFYLAWATWRDKAAFAVDTSSQGIGAGRIVVKAFLLNIRKAVVESPRVQAWLRRGFATVFAGLGANLASAER